MGLLPIAAGDSSPCSAESSSSFRELDEVFLRTQTRIWLGEVLGTRLDEDLHISDLLQDGEILFEVSKVIWNLLLTKCMELKHLKHKYGPFGSRKSSGRYRPYSNVDSFLKTCKILGLSGIDLFSPSDVVEKRDIRKVCICIRALSKKARSKLLSVPDFDVVMYSVAMPTDMVGGIRRSLESAQSTLSSTSSYNSHKGSQTKQRRENLYSSLSRDDESSSDESDEAESRYMGEISFSSASKFGDDAGMNFDLEHLPEDFSTIRHSEKQNLTKSDIKWQSRKDNTGCQSARSPEALLISSPEILEKNYQLDVVSSSCLVSEKSFYHGVSHSIYKLKNNTQNGNEDVTETKFILENDGSVAGDTSSIDLGERNYISDYLAFSDLMVHASNGSPSAMLEGDNNMFDFFLNVNSQRLPSDKGSFQNGSQKRYSDDEDMEVSSTTSMSSVVGRMLSLEFDDPFDADESLTMNVYSSGSTEHGVAKPYKNPFVSSDTQKAGTCGTPLHSGSFDCEESQTRTLVGELFLNTGTKLAGNGSTYLGVLAPRTQSVPTTLQPPSPNKGQFLPSMEFSEGESCSSQLSSLENALSVENGNAVVIDNNGTPLCKDEENESINYPMFGSDCDHVLYGSKQKSKEFGCKISGVTSYDISFACDSGSLEQIESSDAGNQMVISQDNDGGEVTSPVVSHDAENLRSTTPATVCETISENYPCSPVKDNHVPHNTHHETIISAIQIGSQDESKVGQDIITEDVADGKMSVPHEKHVRRKLLKTIIRGTAVAGVLFFLLQIRKSRSDKLQETKQPSQFPKYRKSKFTMGKQQTGSRGKGAYPAEKIKLAN